MAARIQREPRRGRPKGYGFRTGNEGRRLRCIKGARRAHETIRASGRVPGEEARVALASSRLSRKRDQEQGGQCSVGRTTASQQLED